MCIRDSPNALQFGGGESKDQLLFLRDFFKELQSLERLVDNIGRGLVEQDGNNIGSESQRGCVNHARIAAQKHRSLHGFNR